MVSRPPIEIRGAAARLAKEWPQNDEIVICGPAGTGKTMAISWILDELCSSYPGAHILVCRKTRVELVRSWMRTFRKAMAMRGDRDHLFTGPSDRGRESYKYRNGSELVVAGLDDPRRHFSAEYDAVYVNECQQLTLEEWETFNRAMREGVLPRQLLLGDCNPDASFHWILKRAKKGVLRLWNQLHEHNPWLTEDPQGRAYLARLRRTLTGPRRARLLYNRWETTEGAIYPDYSDSTHMVSGYLEEGSRGSWWLNITSGLGATTDGPPVRKQVYAWLAGVDFGTVAPGCLQVWAVDEDNRLHLVWEWYHTWKSRSGWWAKRCAEAHAKLRLEAAVCDHAEPGTIDDFNKHLGWKEEQDTDPIALGCEKTKIGGGSNLDLVRKRMGLMPDGYPGLVLWSDTLQHAPDPDLDAKAKPTRTSEEIPAYVYADIPVDRLGREKENKEDPRRVDNHGCNAMEYVVRYCHGRRWSGPSRVVKIPKESLVGRLGLTPETDPELFELEAGADVEYEWEG